MPPLPNLINGAAALAVVCLIGWAQDDDSKRIADQQDAEARASRKWVAAQHACPKGHTAEWLDDKTLRCLRELDEPKLVAGGRT